MSQRFLLLAYSLALIHSNKHWRKPPVHTYNALILARVVVRTIECGSILAWFSVNIGQHPFNKHNNAYLMLFWKVENYRVKPSICRAVLAPRSNEIHKNAVCGTWIIRRFVSPESGPLSVKSSLITSSPHKSKPLRVVQCWNPCKTRVLVEPS